MKALQQVNRNCGTKPVPEKFRKIVYVMRSPVAHAALKASSLFSRLKLLQRSASFRGRFRLDQGEQTSIQSLRRV
jgi:hypothetical protein